MTMTSNASIIDETLSILGKRQYLRRINVTLEFDDELMLDIPEVTLDVIKSGNPLTLGLGSLTQDAVKNDEFDWDHASRLLKDVSAQMSRETINAVMENNRLREKRQADNLKKKINEKPTFVRVSHQADQADS